MKKVLDALIDVLIILLFAVSLLVVVMSLSSRSAGIANIKGVAFFSVQTDSMEPTIMAGDLMISRLTKNDTVFEVGDVVTFEMYVDRTKILNSHRIVSIREVNGVTYYATKGDNSSGQDQRELSSGDIVAKWTGKKLGSMGKVMDFLQTQKGFFICVLLPLALFFLYMLYGFVKNLVEYNREKAEEAAAASVQELTEEQKKKAIEEYLAAQRQLQETAESSSAEAAKPEVKTESSSAAAATNEKRSEE